MTDDNTTQVGFEVNADAYEKAKSKLPWGGVSSELRTKVHELAYGTQTTERRRLKDKLEDLRKERREIDNDIDEKKHERDEKERGISRVEERLDTLMQQDGEYDGFLEAIESNLHQGYRVDPNHGQIEDAADLGDCTRDEVIKDLKERNPELPDKAFREPNHDEPANWKEQQGSRTQI